MTLRLIALVAAVVALPGCRSLVGSCHEPAAYQEAKEAAPLKIPPGLEAPDTRNALRIPELKEPAPPPRKEGDSCLDAPPKYSVPRTVRPEA